MAEIYNHYVRLSVATLALEPICTSKLREQWQAREELPWLVSEQEHHLLGYASAKFYNSRKGYMHTLETTIYMHPDQRSRGHGRSLYLALLNHERIQSAHCLIAGISLPNEPSVRLHESLGFQKVAHLPQVGRKLDRWVDVGLWCRLRRNSA